ncbi:hypothetical protein [Paenibacillus sp. MDMC362]|uniref:glycosyltransferase family protein n=1 Tax=Paenibacillus sp. MDMC362 TaxID=2977365 RepID=UPI000DC55FE7|nr:hypothetical protein [Paenibacillus sp. MDMC362]RAR42392.1 hypothetical protein DP091_18485 [Paenibacillus sp. MDMC362]
MKVAYLMHVDWNWIKQRPHFLYEELTFYYNVDLFYVQKIYNRKSNEINNSRDVHSFSKINILKKIPYSGRFRKLQLVEKLINQKTIIPLKNYDYIWITSPIILDFVSLDNFQGKIVIYDCMDDFLGFYSGMNGIDRLKQLEIDLVKRSDVIFTSSSYLKEKMKSIYRDELKEPPLLVNNGISSTLFKKGDINDSAIINISKSEGLLNLMYIGTIGNWIDFETILYMLQQNPIVKFTMIGPVDVNVPRHSRINYIGAVKHEQLTTYANNADAFIMPFKLSELVRSVDPVKIYEYILFNKPVLAIDYGEMHKFLPFVNLYANKEELLKLVGDLQTDKIETYSRKKALSFLNHHTWSARAEQIVSILEGVSK